VPVYRQLDEVVAEATATPLDELLAIEGLVEVATLSVTVEDIMGDEAALVEMFAIELLVELTTLTVIVDDALDDNVMETAEVELIVELVTVGW